MGIFDSRVSVPGGERPILLVDDDAEIRGLVRLILSREGMRTIEATTGEEAIGLAVCMPPCAVVLDLNLPRCSGEEVATRLRKLQPANLPIVVLSGAPDAPDVAARIGAVACLGKPFNVSELVAVVHDATAPHRARSARHHRPSARPGDRPSRPVTGEGVILSGAHFPAPTG